eukprot:UN05067
MGNSSIPIFYHGVSQTMLFNSTYICLHCPVSTTRDFIIAWSIFGSRGVVLDIKNDNSGAIYFNCNFWSSFTNEDERLYFSGRSPLMFINIHHIPKQEHYKPLVKLITICNQMFTGYPLEGIKPFKSTCKTLNKLIKSEMDECYLDEPYTSKVPKYISFLFHQFIKQQKEIEINWDDWDTHFIYHDKTFKDDVYGYKLFQSIFISDNKSTFRFSILIKLCCNVQSITIYKLMNSRQGFLSSIKLDEGFVCEIMECMDIM